MKASELKQIIREEIRRVALQELKTKVEKIISILGIQFKVVPSGAGWKFEFKDVDQFKESGIHVNELVAEIQKMLDNKFGKDVFSFMPAGRDQTDPKVNGLEFQMNASNFFKDL